MTPMRRALAAGAGALFAVASARAVPPPPVIRPAASNAFDTAALSRLGRAALSDPDFAWQHAETPHFVLHHNQPLFMQKIAGMAEFFYGHISADLKLTNDRFGACRSHVFLFDRKDDWQRFRERHGQVGEWAASFVRGPEMFLQRMADGSKAADALSHEMTHLVLNRFLGGALPLALNEGLAEWYGEFAYAAYKGNRKSRRQAFGGLARPFPLALLLEAREYPRDPAAVPLFYLTAKHLVGYLRMEQPPGRFGPFLLEAAQPHPSTTDLLLRHYGFSELADLERDFRRFVK